MCAICIEYGSCNKICDFTEMEWNRYMWMANVVLWECLWRYEYWNSESLITHIVWCDICRVVIIHNQHFPQCLQANAVVCCVFEMIIGPGHWMGGNWSHYPIMWITVNECRYLRQISSNHRICLLTIIRLSNTYQLMQTVHLWYVSHQTVLAFVWCTLNTCYTIVEAVLLLYSSFLI